MFGSQNGAQNPGSCEGKPADAAPRHCIPLWSRQLVVSESLHAQSGRSPNTVTRFRPAEPVGPVCRLWEASTVISQTDLMSELLSSAGSCFLPLAFCFFLLLCESSLQPVGLKSEASGTSRRRCLRENLPSPSTQYRSCLARASHRITLMFVHVVVDHQSGWSGSLQ